MVTRATPAGGAPLRYAELFAGAGGLSMGLELAGWEAVAHAEIDPHARAVLREHWPDCRLDGDVSQVNGADYAGAMLLSGGSPCQDLSVAGKRSGMTEGSGTRSSLYFEQVRIWQESGAPYLLWENVLGAFSSNDGRDFAAVLSALVGAPIAVPADGWESAGVAAGPTGVAAWRVLDCQFFGPPQRRRRVFVLGARAGGVDPAEVLALSEGVRGDSPPRREAREGTAADAGGGAGERVPTLVANGDAHSGFRDERGLVLAHLALNNDSRAAATSEATAPLRGGGSSHPTVITYDARGNGDGATVNTMAGDHQHRVTDYTALVVSPTITAGAHPGGANGQDAPQIAAARIAAAPGIGIPRRLMPIETERLMGWPDHHTAYGVSEDGTRYALSDTARYRLCGNGCVAPVVAWIAFRLRWAIESSAMGR